MMPTPVRAHLRRTGPVRAHLRRGERVLAAPSLKRDYGLRIELWCGACEGQRDSTEEAIGRYTKAMMVAEQFSIPVFFDASLQDGTVFTDGYIYPNASNIIEVLNALDAAGVEYDNIDVPSAMKTAELTKTLLKRYPYGSGASVNLGSIDEKAPTHRFYNSGMSIRGLQSFVDDNRES